ncbi:MAG: SDR family oxidoreductase [Parachlamydiaceae bacterium]
MKIVVVGGTGLIGSKLVNKLSDRGHEVIAASPSRGINTLTGEGLQEALKGASVVVDVSNSPSFEDKAVLEFFERSTRNLLESERSAGVKHHVALSVVGTDRLTESGYFRAKLAQENLIKASPVPYTIVRATQFFEFLDSVVQSSVVGQTVHLPVADIQPIASVDVAEALLQAALDKPKNGISDIAGPKRYRFAEIVELYLKATNDARKVISDGNARYFGTKLSDDTLVPLNKAHLGSVSFETWFKQRSH